VGRTLGGLLLDKWGRGWGWHGDRERAIRQRDRLLAHRRIDRLQGVVMRGEDLVQGFPEILQHMKAIRDLGGLGRAVTSAFRIGARAISRNDLHPGVLPQPLRHCLGRAIREERHGLVALQIDQDRPIRLAFPQGEIVHPKDGGCGKRRNRQPPEQTQQGVPAHHQAPLVADVHASLATQRQGNGHETLGEPQRAPRPGGGHGGQAFGEDPATAVTIAAEPLADAQLETHAVLRPRQIGQGPFVTAVDTPRRCGAQRTGHAGLRRAYPQGDLRRGVIDMTRLEAQCGRIR
jgi:hypothetical protein